MQIYTDQPLCKVRQSFNIAADNHFRVLKDSQQNTLRPRIDLFEECFLKLISKTRKGHFNTFRRSCMFHIFLNSHSHCEAPFCFVLFWLWLDGTRHLIQLLPKLDTDLTLQRFFTIMLMYAFMILVISPTWKKPFTIWSQASRSWQSKNVI